MGQGSGRFDRDGTASAGAPSGLVNLAHLPPKNLGEVGVGQGLEAGRHGSHCVRRRPPSPALPPQTAWGRGDATRPFRSGIEFSSPPGFFGGEAGRGGAPRTQPDAFRRTSSPLRDERAGRGRGGGPLRTQFDGCRSGIEFSSSPAQRGRGPGGGGPVGRQFDAVRRACQTLRHPQPPPAVLGEVYEATGGGARRAPVRCSSSSL